jgi:hypothetical protein
MSIEGALFTGLRTLVADRVYPLNFPQTPAPVWPAIRYTFPSFRPATALCGDSGDKSATTRVQLDIVAETYVAARALRLQVMAVMKVFEPPAVLDGGGEDPDLETKTYRIRLDYLIFASSPLPI